MVHIYLHIHAHTDYPWSTLIVYMYLLERSPIKQSVESRVSWVRNPPRAALLFSLEINSCPGCSWLVCLSTSYFSPVLYSRHKLVLSLIYRSIYHININFHWWIRKATYDGVFFSNRGICLSNALPWHVLLYVGHRKCPTLALFV